MVSYWCQHTSKSSDLADGRPAVVLLLATPFVIASCSRANAYSDRMSHSRLARRRARGPGRALLFGRASVFGRAPSRVLLATAMVTAFAVTGSSTAQAVVSCDLAEGFSRMSDGNLFRLQDPTLLSAANSMTQSGQVGRGWGTFAWTGAGGDGVIYVLTMTGQLLWYRWDAAGNAWAPKSGTVIGVGFTPGSRVTNIAVGADGWIYTVRPDKRLVAYRHLGRLTGGAAWGNSGGFVLGSGWTAGETIAPQGDGVIYRQLNGNLYLVPAQ